MTEPNTQTIIDNLIGAANSKRLELDTIVARLWLILRDYAKTNPEEAWNVYRTMLQHELIATSYYTSSTPMCEEYDSSFGESPYDDLFMGRGSSLPWSEIYSHLKENVNDSLDDWIRSVIESKTTHFCYDW